VIVAPAPKVKTVELFAGFVQKNLLLANKTTKLRQILRTILNPAPGFTALVICPARAR